MSSSRDNRDLFSSSTEIKSVKICQRDMNKLKKTLLFGRYYC